MDTFSLNHIVYCGLVSLLDESLVIGYFLFLIASFVMDLSSCWMQACSLDVVFLNHIVCCDLVFLLDARLVIGYIYLDHLLVVGLRPCWMEARSLDDFLLNHIGCCGLFVPVG